jgi:prepilin-type N-terminal cleavage/methylation domain-containing protein
MIKNIEKEKKQSGFTLIELLVVISIIALLSTIVLAGIQDARGRAQNTKLNEIAMQYVNAFALLTVDGTNFPNTGTSPVDYACLGYDETPDDPCYYDFYDGDEDINNALIEYYPDLPKNEDFHVTFSGTYTASGIIYYCPNTSSLPFCQLRWYLKNPGQKCILGAEPQDVGGIATYCIYSFI